MSLPPEETEEKAENDGHEECPSSANSTKYECRDCNLIHFSVVREL